MKLAIEMKLDNAAFAEDARFEVARILKEYADRIESGAGLNAVIRDVNGNKVGFAEIVMTAREHAEEEA